MMVADQSLNETSSSKLWISDRELGSSQVKKSKFNGEWNDGLDVNDRELDGVSGNVDASNDYLEVKDLLRL